MKTILTNSYFNEQIYLDLFERAKSNSLSQIRLLDFYSWINSQSTMKADSLIFHKISNEIKLIQDQLTIYGKMIQYPTFIEQIYDFYTMMIQYHISIDDLPSETIEDKEKKLLIQCCQKIITPHHQTNQVIESLGSIENIYYVDHCIDSIAMKNIMNNLTGINRYPLPIINRTSTTLYHALNARQEIEACAQWICTHHLKLEDVNIILCDPTNQIYLSQVFERYNLDYGLTSKKKNSKIVESFIPLFHFYNDENLNNLIECLKTSLFSKINTSSFIEYCSIFSDVDYRQPFDRISRLELDSKEIKNRVLMQLETDAEEIRLQIISYFLNDAEHPLVKSYNTLCSSWIVEKQEERQCLLRIQNLLLELQFDKLTSDDYKFILYEIEKISISSFDSYTNRICVTDLDHPVKSRPYSFVLHGNQKNYPQFKSCSGLFEESYVSKISSLPTKESRAIFCSDYKSWIFNSGAELFLSYAICGYDGKGLECSFDLKNYARQESLPWPLLEVDENIEKHYTLNTDLAKQLFVKNHSIVGSISTFEKYANCPYSYFLHSGLKLRDKSNPQIDIATIGSLQHACIEKSIAIYKQNYATISLVEINSIVAEQFSKLYQIYPNQIWLIDTIQARCVQNLKTQLDFLSDFETHTDLVYHDCEVKFQEILFADEEISITLNGIIDRIDTSLDFLRVIDYKSSLRGLVDKKIKYGLQIQLLTYLMIAVNLTNKKPIGAYYYSFKTETSSVEAANLNLRSNTLSVLDDDSYYQDWFNSNRFKGKTFDESVMNDHYKNHIVNIKKVEDYSYWIEQLLKVYSEIKNSILSGSIDCTPTEGACAFCDYRCICQYAGKTYITNVLINDEECDDDAEME